MDKRHDSGNTSSEKNEIVAAFANGKVVANQSNCTDHTIKLCFGCNKITGIDVFHLLWVLYEEGLKDLGRENFYQRKKTFVVEKISKLFLDSFSPSVCITLFQQMTN